MMIPLVLSLGTYRGGLLPSVTVANAQGPPRLAVNPERIADLAIPIGVTKEFAVNLTDAPAINGFAVVLTYNASILDALSLDYRGNVLESTKQAENIIRNCVDNAGISCQPDDGDGVVSLAITVLGSNTTTSPTSGSLFKVQFKVISVGFTQIHIQTATLSAPVVNSQDGSITITIKQVAVVTTDGFFSNVDCPRGSSILCEPPTADFTYSPPRPLQNDLVIFNASLSHGPGLTTITRYFWLWGEPSSSGSTAGYAEYCKVGDDKRWCTTGQGLPLNSTAEHEFKSTCTCLVTLTVTDSDGISWSTTIPVAVIHSLVDLMVKDVQPTQANLVTPGTIITVKATVQNVGTIALNGSLQIILEASHGVNKTLGDPLSLTNLKPNAARETTATWDTSSYNPRVYRILAVVPVVAVNSTLYENVTINNVRSTWIQLIEPFSAGLSLDLLSSSGLGILVLVGGGFAVSWARRRRSPTEVL